MSAQNVVLLDEARARRAKAQHVRRLCHALFDQRAVEALSSYANELEKQAADLESKVERTAHLADEIAREIAKAHETLAQINGTLSKAVAT